MEEVEGWVTAPSLGMLREDTDVIWPLTTPVELAAALSNDGAAKSAFAAMPPSHRAEYCKWIAEAKKPETREKRARAATEKIKAWAAGRKR